MKRSSRRRAKRWILQELMRCLDQSHEPLSNQTRSFEAWLMHQAGEDGSGPGNDGFLPSSTSDTV